MGGETTIEKKIEFARKEMGRRKGPGVEMLVTSGVYRNYKVLCRLRCMPSTPQVTQTLPGNPAGLETAATVSVITAALQTAANAVVITDAKGIILWINSAFTNLTGYSSEEVVGRTPRLLKSGKHDPELYRNLWTTVLAGKTWRGEFTNRRKDGSLYQDEHTITPVFSSEGVITHIVAIMDNVTERRRAEQQLTLLNTCANQCNSRAEFRRSIHAFPASTLRLLRRYSLVCKRPQRHPSTTASSRAP